MRMAQNYKTTANFSDSFSTSETGKSGIIYAGCLPHMRQNYRLSRNNVQIYFLYHITDISGGGDGRRHGAVGVLDLWAICLIISNWQIMTRQS